MTVVSVSERSNAGERRKVGERSKNVECKLILNLRKRAKENVWINGRTINEYRKSKYG